VLGRVRTYERAGKWRGQNVAIWQAPPAEEQPGPRFAFRWCCDGDVVTGAIALGSRMRPADLGGRLGSQSVPRDAIFPFGHPRTDTTSQPDEADRRPLENARRQVRSSSPPSQVQRRFGPQHDEHCRGRDDAVRGFREVALPRRLGELFHDDLKLRSRYWWCRFGADRLGAMFARFRLACGRYALR
jgi:hypothetical protein